MKQSFVLIFILILAIPSRNCIAQYLNIPHIIENKGQWNSEIKFIGISDNIRIFVYPSNILIFSADTINKPLNINLSSFNMGQALTIKNDNVIFSDRFDTYYNFFIGNDKSKWASGVGLYKSVSILAEGRKNIKINAGNDRFCIEFNGLNSTDLNILKGLINNKIIGNCFIDYLSDHQLSIVDTGLNKAGKTESQTIVNRDFSQLSFSTFLGGRGDDFINDMDIDEYGYVYLSGDAFGLDFPLTPDSYDNKLKFLQIGFYSVFTPNANSLKYSTFFGDSISGSSINLIKCSKKNHEIFLSGIVYLLSNSPNDNFPVTDNAFQKVKKGRNDLFLARFDSSGKKLIYSTLIGGNKEDLNPSFEIGKDGQVYLVAVSESKDYPITPDAMQDTLVYTYDGEQNGVLGIINTDTGELLYSSFYGNSIAGEGPKMLLDMESNVIIYALAWKRVAFVTTQGVIMEEKDPNAKEVGMIVKFKSDLKDVLFATYFPGFITDCRVDKNNNIYLFGFVGYLFGYTLPITENHIDSLPIPDNTAIFISKINTNATEYIYSTCIIDPHVYGRYCMDIDENNNVWIANGFTSENFPITDNAFQKEYANSTLTKIRNDFTKITYSTFFGGLGSTVHEHFTSKIISKGDYLYVAGANASYGFPTTAEAYQPFPPGGYDGFVTKFDFTKVGVEEELEIANSELIDIYPNPSGEYIEIRIPENRRVNPMDGKVGEIRIYNTMGECVMNYELRITNYEKERIDISGLNPGVYYMKYGIYINKFVKM